MVPTNAGDAHYAQMLDHIQDHIAMDKASLAAYESGERKHWYYIHSDYCPVCGSDDTVRYQNVHTKT